MTTRPDARAGARPAPREATPRWLTDEEQLAWRAYLHGARLLEVALDADLAAAGVSLPEYEILSMLSEAPGGRMRMSALADLVVQSRSRVTHTASRLEKQDLVVREPCPEDGRGVELVLTGPGRTRSRCSPACTSRVSGSISSTCSPRSSSNRSGPR